VHYILTRRGFDEFSRSRRSVRGSSKSSKYLGEIMAKDSEETQRFRFPVTQGIGVEWGELEILRLEVYSLFIIVN
jgi:hypothetical protein